MPPRRMIDPHKPLIDQFQDENLTSKLYPQEDDEVDTKPFPVQKTILASVSRKLANHCISLASPRQCVLLTDSKTLGAFFKWVLRCPIKTRNQQVLVQAWQFGHEWEMPVFQNAVMRRLVEMLHADYVDEFAIRQAYCAVDPRGIERDKLLRKAFISQVAFDSQPGAIWDEKECVSSGLDKCIDFYKDYTNTMCLVPDDDDYNPRKNGALIEELLVDESYQ